MALTWHSLFETTGGIAAIATIALAIATTILAVGTIVTARGTKETARETARLAALTEEEVRVVASQADAARQEVEVSRRALQASIKPHLVSVRAGRITYGHPPLRGLVAGQQDLSTTWIQVPFRNVGPGLAFIQRAVMYWNEVGAPINPVAFEGTARVKVVPSGEEGLAHFWFGDELNSKRALKIAEDAKEFWAEVTHTDGAGEQAERTRFTLRISDDGKEWLVREISLYEDNADQPYVSSGVQ